ncbi:hypothetical protein E5288_WYG001778 [Bos mutus]|uniref:Nucleosome assembly protein 1-like 1 n=2 Tax=Bos mutus TaxID=72004 RepID=A0A6B0RRD2_9CETA|nr:hypothetical protein [Bos mutus]
MRFCPSRWTQQMLLCVMQGGAQAARLPALATGELSWKTKFAIFENIWHLYNMADIDNKEQSELDQDLDDVEEVEEETGEETKIKAHQLTVQMMQNPQILAALQERLDGLVETPTGYVESLPRVVKRRVNALKNLQVKCAQIEAKFYEEVHDLERKYSVLYQPLFDKRFEIINAIYEPTEEECEWKPGEEDEISEELKEKAKIEDEKKDEEKEDPKGIPEFWLTVFKNVDLLSDTVQEHDEPILKHLKDIKVKFSDAGQPMSFVLEFHFEPNEYFTNEVLTKTYRMRSEPQGSDDSDPFSFDGPEIMGCTGCQIDCKKGKNVTLKTIKKKQKHKGRGTVRTVTKTVSNDSFFNFFAPPEVPESGDLDDDSEAILAADFEIGHFLRDHIIPRSVLYFTGEAIEDDDDDYDEEGEEADEEGEEEGDEENDPDCDPKKDQNPAECKQQ